MSLRRLVTAVMAGVLVAGGLVAAPAVAAGPPTPTGLAADSYADGTIHFEWAPSPGASAYRLEWSADSSFPSGAVTTVDTYALDYTTRWQISPGAATDIYWRVSAFGNGTTTSTLGTPTESSLVQAGEVSIPQPIGPGTSAGVEEIVYPDPTVFSWEPVDGAIAYQLEYTSDTLGGGAGIVTQTVPGTQYAPANPLARVDNAGNMLTWKWRVRAQFYNGTTSSSPAAYGGWSAQRDFQITWDMAPTNLFPADAVDPVFSDLSFSWDAVPGAAKYRVTLGNATDGVGSSTTILNPIVRDVYTTTYIPTAQASDSTRYWQVTPLDYAGNLGTPSPVHQYRKKWGTQNGPSAPLTAENAAPVGITGSTDSASAPEVYLSDLEISWQPLQRATFYMLEVRDEFSNLYTCRTASTSATMIARYEDGLDNSGNGKVLEGADECIWEDQNGGLIREGRTYNWRVRAADYAGSLTTPYQLSSLPSGVQLSNWSQTRYFTVKAEDRAIPTQTAVDLDLDAFVIDNPASASGQPAPVMSWSPAGYYSNGSWQRPQGYMVTFYKNPQRTAEIGFILTSSTSVRLNGVLDDNITANPYYAAIYPINTTLPKLRGDIILLGGIDNESVESFVWEKSSHPLTGLSTQTLTDGSVRLSWNPQSMTGLQDGGSRGYQIRVYNGSVQQGVTKKIEFPFFMAQKPASSTDTEFPSTIADTPLPPGNNYSFDVAPLDANGNPGPVTKSGTFSVGVATPSVTDAATVVGGSAALNWSSVPGALKYAVQYRRVGNATWTTVNSVSQTAATINSLDKGNYEWQVQTQDLASNLSPWSSTQVFSVGADPSAISLTDAVVLPLNDRVLRWSSAVDGATRFQVQVADDSNFTTAVKNYETVTTELALPDSLTAVKQYYWRVKALAEPVGSSSSLKVLATSATDSFTVRTTPSKVTAPTITRGGPGELKATWPLLTGASAGTVEPITYVVAYREKSLDDDWSGAIEIETLASASTLTVGSLVAGTTYQFRVAGRNSEGLGPWSDAKELATATAPTAAPTLTTTPKLGALQVGFSLVTSANGNSPITGYVLRYRTAPDGDWTEKQLPVSTSYMISGLTNLTDYQVSIAAVNAVGEGPAAEGAARTLGLSEAPDTVKATRGDKSASITWEAPLVPNGTVTGYVLEYRLGTTGTWTSAGSATASTFKVTKTGLVNGKTYQFRVAAKTSVGTGTFSAPVSVMPAGKPILSSTLTATSSSTGTVTIAWGKASSNGSAVTGYTVKYSTNGTTWYTLKTVSASTYKTTSTKGSHGKKVYFRLYATNGVGTSAYKSVSVIRK